MEKQTGKVNSRVNPVRGVQSRGVFLIGRVIHAPVDGV